jgi:hypothetical protein
MDKEKGSVEGLKDKLYSRANQAPMQDVRAPLSHEEVEVPKAWEGGAPRQRILAEPIKDKLSFATKFFIVSAGFFIAALAVSAIAFFWGPNTISPNNIDIQIVAPSLVDGGKEATFQIVIDNKNPGDLQVADLVLDYPDGSRDPQDPTQPLLHDRQSIGTIAAGSEVKRTGNVILYGSEGQTETVRATLEYSVAGSNAIFTRQSEVTLTIGSSPVSVTVNTPSQAVAGQSFPLDVVVRSNATDPVANVVVQGLLPFGYQLVSAQPQASAGSFWRLGTLNPGQQVTIHIMGTIDGQDGDQRVFKFLVGTNTDPTDTTVKVPLLTMPATVTVSRPFVSVAIAVGGQSGRTVSVGAGSEVQGTVNWQNNLQTPVSNVQVTLVLSGAMIDTSSVNAGTGFWRSSDNSIVWTPDRDPTLATAAAGQNGQLMFSFKTRAPGQGGTIYTNPTATLSATVQAERPADQSGGATSVSSTAQTQLAIASQVALSVAAHAASGPTPPVANQATTYTVRWSATNSSSVVGNATVSTVLPPYVTFVAGGTGIAYDDASHTVTWQIGDLPAGAGYTKAALANSFTVTLTPSTSQVGTAPTLTGATALAGTDRFAGAPVHASAPAPMVDSQVVGN